MVEMDSLELELIEKEHEGNSRARNRAVIEYVEEQKSTVKHLEIKVVRGQALPKGSDETV